MSRHSLLHLLNLDAVGGVEELFTHFLETSDSIEPCEHHILVTGKPPHPFFKKRLERYKKTITQEKYVCGVKVPSFIRQVKRKRAIALSKPEAIILWNRIEPFNELKKLSPSSQIIYYEHGASWYESKDSSSKEMLKDADKIIANSHAAKRLLQLKWGIDTSITVVENPLKADIQAADAPKKAPTAPFHIGFVGRIIPLKGVALLIHAIKTLHERGLQVSLSIAGDGEDKERLQKEVKRLKLDAYIRFLGCIPNISDFYRSIDLLVVPSIREPLGLVAQEAALSACPVIASLVDGLPEVVLDGKTGYCITPALPLSDYIAFGGSIKKLPDTVYDPISDSLKEPKLVDPIAIADCIERLTKEPDTYEELSRQALAFAKCRPTTLQYSKNLLDTLFYD